MLNLINKVSELIVTSRAVVTFCLGVLCLSRGERGVHVVKNVDSGWMACFGVPGFDTRLLCEPGQHMWHFYLAVRPFVKWG